MSDSIRDRVRMRIEDYYDLKKFSDASEALAGANGLQGQDSILRNSEDKPLKFGGASTNAIAHALTSAYLAHDYSTAQAAALGWGRELNSFWSNEKPPAWDTFKDLYNNQVGRNIADYVRENNLPRNQIQDLLLDALSFGKLIVTQQDKRIDPSFDGNPRKFSLPGADAAPWTAPSAGFPEFASSVSRVPMAPPAGISSSPAQRTTPAFEPGAVYSPMGDFYGNVPRSADAAETPVRYLGRRTASETGPSAFNANAPVVTAPGSPQRSLSLNDAYLEYQRHLSANQPQPSLADAGAPPLVPSDDAKFSSGLPGRLAALMGIDPRNPDRFAPPSQEDELNAFYHDDPEQPWGLQRRR